MSDHTIRNRIAQ